MALQDQNLVLSSAQAITASALSTNAYDLLNGNTLSATSAAYTTNSIIGNATVFGEDLGLGRGVGTPTIEVFSGSGTPITATSLQIAAQGAVDAGTGNTSGLTFVTYIETGAIAIASILASHRLAAFDLPRRSPETAMPRFIALDYIVGGSSFSGLTVTAYINLGGTSAQSSLGQYPANF